MRGKTNHVITFKRLSLSPNNCCWGEVLHPRVNQMHISMPILSCSSFLWLRSPCLRPSLKQGLCIPCFSRNLAAEILVQTGNSVDYSLAIRLLSLQWLSLLHHEIAWLSARLESVLCSNPPRSPPTRTPQPLTQPPVYPAKQTLPFP